MLLTNVCPKRGSHHLSQHIFNFIGYFEVFLLIFVVLDFAVFCYSVKQVKRKMRAKYFPCLFLPFIPTSGTNKLTCNLIFATAPIRCENSVKLTISVIKWTERPIEKQKSRFVYKNKFCRFPLALTPVVS